MPSLRRSSLRRSGLAVLVGAWLLAMALPASVMAGSGRFVDDDGSRYESSIEAVARAGIMTACNPPRNDRFCPKADVSRGAMAVYLVRTFHLTATSGVRFRDVPKHGSKATAIDKVVTAGIAAGCSKRRFCPDAAVTRGRMAVFVTQGAQADRNERRPVRRRLDAPPVRHRDQPSRDGGPRDLVRQPPVLPEPRHQPRRDRRLPPAGQVHHPITAAQPAPGNPDGSAPVPPGAGAADSSSPDHVIGKGTPASCTSAAVVGAVAKGGVITFDCGPKPVTIKMAATAKVFNDKPDLVIDGGGLVTLDGQDARRILYMNTCDQSLVWTTGHCQNQDHPTLTVQNIAFVNGRSSGHQTEDGGGAIFVRGGRFRVVNAGFYGNRCASTGPDIGGASLQVFSQYNGLPVYIVNSTFGGSGSRHNECSNAGGVSSIGVSWTILNSVFTGNRAIGSGANPPKDGKPGGGNGGAIYNDGNEMTLRVLGTRIEGNWSNHEGGSGIFFVSNDRSGSVEITDSILRNNTGDGFSTYPGIFFLGDSITFTNSTVE